MKATTMTTSRGSLRQKRNGSRFNESELESLETCAECRMQITCSAGPPAQTCSERSERERYIFSFIYTFWNLISSENQANERMQQALCEIWDMNERRG
jgi:hypothetical protein